jgi:hypothetical protein
MIWGANNARNNTLDMIVVQPGPDVTGGPIVVTVNDQPSTAEYSFKANSGHVYYVAGGGADNKSCSMTTPCATILYAATIMKPGDILLVRGGAYAEGEIWIRAAQSGAPGQPKVIKNYPGEDVYLTNKVRDVLIDADYFTVSGLNFRNGKALFATGWASTNQKGLKFINNSFVGAIGYAAIELTGNDHVVAGNVCEVSGSTVGTMGHCYYITQGSNLRIAYNIAAGAPGYGLHIYDERRAAADFRRVIRNVVVEGNVLKSSTQRSGLILTMSDAGGYGNVIDNVTIRNNIMAANNHLGLLISGVCRNIKVYNNTFYQNGRQAIYIENDGKINGVDIRNNLIYQSPNGNCNSNCDNVRQAHVRSGAAAQNVVINNNYYYPGLPVVLGGKDASAITGPVQFANEGALDFHVLYGSSVIDHGITLAGVPTDCDGRRRPQGAAFDIGAYELAQRTPAVP